MPTDNRISTLPELTALYSDINLLAPIEDSQSNADADVLFLITKSGQKNEKITFKNLKSSILGNTVSLSGAQTISGEKTFADICTFEDTVFLNEVVDTTYEGDISGYNFVAESGLFEKLGVGTAFRNKTRTPEYSLHVDGDACIEGNFSVLGEINLGGEFQLDNVSVAGDLRVAGSGVFESGINVKQDSTFSGALDVTGTGFFGGDLNVSGDLFVENKIAHIDDNDTYIQFSDNQIAIKATGSNVTIGESIEFSVSGENKLAIDTDGRLLINSNEALGDFSMSGAAYIDELYIAGQDGEWEKLTPRGYDESVHFSTNLVAGEDVYEIDFPKTFGSKPVVHVTLNNDGGGEVVAFNIKNITNSSYFISFSQPLSNDNYSVETQATTSAEYSLHQTLTQSFTRDIIQGQESYTIEFPNPFLKKPTVSATLERQMSYNVDYPAEPGDAFTYNSQFYFAIDQNVWRRATFVEQERAPGVPGETQFDNDFFYVCINDTLWGSLPLVFLDVNPPPQDLDDDGFDYDDNFIYVQTSEGWKRSAISSWLSEGTPTFVPYMISNVTESSFQINFASQLKAPHFLHIIASR